MSKITQFCCRIRRILPEVLIYEEESMAKHTSFRIGGNARVMVFPSSEEELSQIVKMSVELDIKPVILGAGTNVLAPDEGMDAVVICLKDHYGSMQRLTQTQIQVGAGITMARCAMYAASLGLSGLEFAHGIPGTVGGGVYMNAGAYGGEIKDVCTKVRIMNEFGECCWLSREEAGFSYRHSGMEDNPWIILEAQFQLEEKPEEEIRARMAELIAKRRASQPLDLPSAGSAFKRPVGGYAAALIEQAGLKGYCVGGAGVSEKHAGFVVNHGDATAADVKQLLRDVIRIVDEKSGIHLEPEIRIW